VTNRLARFSGSRCRSRKWECR